MARKRVPQYGLHRASGQARVTIDGKSRYLGKHGSAESYAAYRAAIDEWLESGSRPDLTLHELVSQYQHYADTFYGHGHSELYHLRTIMAALSAYGATAARDFGPRTLRHVRAKLVDRGLARKTINQDVQRIVRIFKWAVSEELVPVEAWQGLTALAPLKRGSARDPQPVLPVDRAAVDAVLPIVSPQVAAMIELQWLTGARPGEVTILRGCDLDRTVDPWEYRPASHKLQHLGRERLILAGPLSQDVLREWLRDDPAEYLFQPREWCQTWRDNLTTSGRSRKPSGRERLPGDHYTTDSYRTAVQRACRAVGVPVWSPNQLRHTCATRIKAAHGHEAAQLALGHSKPDTTAIYAERNLDEYRRVAAAIS